MTHCSLSVLPRAFVYPPADSGSRRRTRRLDRPDVDLNLVTLHAQVVRVESVADEVGHALATGAVEAPLVMRAGDDLPVEGNVALEAYPHADSARDRP